MQKTCWWSWAVVSVTLCLPVEAGAQTLVGALAIDERQGDRYGWAVDYEGAPAAGAAALGECGAGCAVVLTFARCGAYAADPSSGSTAYGWGESYAAAAGARSRALSECRSRGGTDCVVRAWGCNGPVVEDGLALDRAARREVQLGLRAGGYDPGGADGLVGPRTRAAIRSWQTSRGARSTGYLDGASAELLRTAGASGASAPTMFAPPGLAQPAPDGGSAASPPASAEFEIVFWQSIVNSTNAADFEAYLAQFPNGVFRVLAQNRLATLRSAAANPAAAGEARVGAGGAPALGRPGAGGTGAFSGDAASGFAGAGGNTAAVDARRQPGEVFRDCAECPEMVVVPAGRFRMGCVSGQDCFNQEFPVHEVQVGSFALSKYEVLFEEYDRFADATGREPPDDRGWGRVGRPVINVSWEDATAYAAWLSAETGEQYRLPSEAEWEYAARAGTTDAYSWGSDIGRNRANCYDCGSRWDREQTAPAGSFPANAWGLHDMHGNVAEWVEDCWHDSYARAPTDGSAWTRGADCGRRVFRGGSWGGNPWYSRSAYRAGNSVGRPHPGLGVRLSRTLTP